MQADKDKVKILDESILDKIPVRDSFAHKGSYGRVLVIAGSEGMSGAAFLAALAAYRAGAGLVKILSPECNRVILQAGIPEAMFAAYDPARLEEDREEFQTFLSRELSWASVIILGPGLGNKPYVRFLVEEVLSSAYVPLIVDADAINTIAKYPYLEKYLTENIILTPHIKEMERLCGTSAELIKEDILGTANDFCDSHAVSLVLKSAHTVIASKGEIYLNQQAAPALAKGGSGDVLAGIIAAMLCLGLEDAAAPALAVYIHNLAARLAATRFSEHGTLARDIIACIPAAMQYRKNKGV